MGSRVAIVEEGFIGPFPQARDQACAQTSLTPRRAPGKFSAAGATLGAALLGLACPTFATTTSLGCVVESEAEYPGGGTLFNNVLDTADAGSFPWQQCLTKRTAPVGAGPDQYGWTWLWPSDVWATYSYPSLVIGTSPWRANSTNSSQLPVAISAASGLKLAYQVDLAASGDFDLSASVWVVRKPTAGTPPAPADITTELMIWSNYTPAMVATPAPMTLRGTFIDASGITWDVWAATNWTNFTGATANTWTHIEYHARQPNLTNKLSVDVMDFVHNAIALGLVNSADYIADVEVGTEIASGTGSAWLTAFALSLSVSSSDQSIDIPAMPGWAVLALAAGLAGMSTMARRRIR